MTSLELNGNQSTANLTITTDQPIAGAQIYLTFDPELIQLQDFSASSFLQNAGTIQQEIDNDAGTALLTLLSPPNNTPTGQGILATVSFTAIKPGQTSISIDKEQTKIAAVGKPENDLSSTTNLNLNLEQNQQTTSTSLNPNQKPSPELNSTYNIIVISTAIILVLIIILITLGKLFKNNRH